jgi:hypothetical protein
MGVIYEKMGRICYFIIGLIALASLYSAEIDKGLVVIDNAPWKTSWVKESNHEWVLSVYFDKGELKTYFKKAPPSKGLGLSADNQPIKQEFVYYGKTHVSRKSQFEQWPDGAKAWAFSYENIAISTDNGKFRSCTTAIIQEVGDSEDEIRYALYRGV